MVRVEVRVEVRARVRVRVHLEGEARLQWAEQSSECDPAEHESLERPLCCDGGGARLGAHECHLSKVLPRTDDSELALDARRHGGGTARHNVEGIARDALLY